MSTVWLGVLFTQVAVLAAVVVVAARIEHRVWQLRLEQAALAIVVAAARDIAPAARRS